jgi:hypothetical protein
MNNQHNKNNNKTFFLFTIQCITSFTQVFIVYVFDHHAKNESIIIIDLPHRFNMKYFNSHINKNFFAISEKRNNKRKIRRKTKTTNNKNPTFFSMSFSPDNSFVTSTLMLMINIRKCMIKANNEVKITYFYYDIKF